MIEYLPELVIWILLLAPIFSLSSWAYTVLPIVTTMLALAFFLMIRAKIRIADNWPNRLFGLFLLILLALLPFSISIIHSVPTLLWLVSCFGVFIYAQSAIADGAALGRLLRVFCLFAVAFGINAVFIFIQTGLTSYTRLESYWGFHNLYAGFLIIPFFASIAFALQRYDGKRDGKYSGKWGVLWKTCWLCASAFLLANSALTFSRGAWLCLAVSGILFGILFWKYREEQKSLFGKKSGDIGRIIASLSVLILVAAAMTGSIWFLARHTTEVRQADAAGSGSSTSPVGVFSDQDSDDNAVTARLHYFDDAFHVFLERPLIGWGLESYPDALNEYKTVPGFYSSDPHDIFLRLLAETGVFGAGAFAALIAVLICSLYARLRSFFEHLQEKEQAMFYFLLFAGIAASALHSLMDIDWHYYPLMLVFFACAGGLLGVLKGVQEKPEKFLPFWVTWFLLAIFLVLTAGAFQLYRADNAAADGDFYKSIQVYQSALQSYSYAIAQDPWEPQYWFDRSEAYYLMKDYQDSEKDLNKAIALYPYDRDYYGSLADLDLALGDNEGYHQALLKTVGFFNPDLSEYVSLISFDMAGRNYSEASSTLSRIIPLYTAYEKTLWFKDDPASGQDVVDLSILKGFQSLLDNQSQKKIDQDGPKK